MKNLTGGLEVLGILEINKIRYYRGIGRKYKIMKERSIFRGTVVIFLVISLYCQAQEKEDNNDYQYALIEAVKQKNLGNISEAAKLYRLVIKEKPNCDVAYYELGNIYLMSNQIELATGNLEKAFLIDRDNKWYFMAYLNALGAGEQFNTMRKILKEKIKNDPEEAEWEYQLANVYFSNGKSNKAIRVLERIEKERGFSEKITLLKASIYESEEKFDLARQEIVKVMELFPEAIQFRIVAAELSLKSGKEEEAAKYYMQILDVDSTNIFALTNLTDYYRKKEDYKESFKYLIRSFNNELIDLKRKKAIISYYLSEEKFIREYPGELEKMLQVFLKVHPDDAEVRLMATDFYIEIKAYDKAFNQLKSFLDSNQGNYNIYMQAILLANAAGNNDELLSMADKAIVQYPDSADFRYYKGLVLYEKEKYSELIENYENTNFDDFSIDEYASISKMLYAEAYYRLKDFAVSDSLFEELISEDPENYMVLNNYSYYLAERGEKLNRALKWSYEAIKNNPDNSTFLDTYAWVLFKMKRYEEAEKFILAALEKGGNNDPEVNEHAGDIQNGLKSFDIAKSYYLKAILLGGDKNRLEKKIESLNSNSDE